jgi:hypothetical protein
MCCLCFFLTREHAPGLNAVCFCFPDHPIIGSQDHPISSWRVPALQVLAFPEDFKPRNSSDIVKPKTRAKIFVTPVFRKFFQRTMRFAGIF